MQLLINIDENEYKALQKMQECGLGYYHEIILAGIPFEGNDVTKGEWPKREEESKQFLVKDINGEFSVQTFYLTVDEPDKQIPYFSGMRDVVAWYPLPRNA